jgi:predicted GNAT family acetyltransferase
MAGVPRSEFSAFPTLAPRVQLYETVAAFLAAADPFVRFDPFSTNVIAVVASRIAAGQEPASDSNLWATVTDSAGHVVGAAMHTPPHHVFLSRMPAEAAAALAQALADNGREVPGVNGALESTRPFAATWRAATGCDSRLVTAERLYSLGTLKAPEAVAGRGITAATPQHVELMAAWLAAFHDEAQSQAPVLQWYALAQRRVAAGQVQLWQDADVFVSLAAFSAPSAGVARIGPVYTPPADRRRGYGAAVTAHATHTALAAGAEHVVLYADLANPISNSIYQKIGFVADHDAEERAFV